MLRPLLSLANGGGARRGCTSYTIGGVDAIALLLILWALHRESPRLGEAAVLGLAVALLARECVGGAATLPSAERRVPLLHDPRALVAAAASRSSNSSSVAGTGVVAEGGGFRAGGVSAPGDGDGGWEGMSLLGAGVDVVKVVGRGKSGFDRFYVRVTEAVSQSQRVGGRVETEGVVFFWQGGRWRWWWCRCSYHRLCCCCCCLLAMFLVSSFLASFRLDERRGGRGAAENITPKGVVRVDTIASHTQSGRALCPFSSPPRLMPPFCMRSPAASVPVNRMCQQSFRYGFRLQQAGVAGATAPTRRREWVAWRRLTEFVALRYRAPLATVQVVSCATGFQAYALNHVSS